MKRMIIALSLLLPCQSAGIDEIKLDVTDQTPAQKLSICLRNLKKPVAETEDGIKARQTNATQTYELCKQLKNKEGFTTLKEIAKRKLKFAKDMIKASTVPQDDAQLKDLPVLKFFDFSQGTDKARLYATQLHTRYAQEATYWQCLMEDIDGDLGELAN